MRDSRSGEEGNSRTEETSKPIKFFSAGFLSRTQRGHQPRGTIGHAIEVEEGNVDANKKPALTKPKRFIKVGNATPFPMQN